MYLIFLSIVDFIKLNVHYPAAATASHASIGNVGGLSR